MGESKMEQFNLNWHTYNDHLKEMMQNLMQSNESTDVTIMCEDKTKFRAHKFVLNACSPVFQSIIYNLPQKDSVIYLSGIHSQEINSILQFMYLGQATFYQDRMNEFLNVAKRLEIKEISKDVDIDGDQSSHDQECNKKIETYNVEEENTVNSSDVAEEQRFGNILTNYKNEADQYNCNKCDKH